MTQILLHPDRLPRSVGAQVYIQPPWQWWETRASGDVITTNTDDNTEYAVTFGVDGAQVILTDPPTVSLVAVSVVDDRIYQELGRSMLVSQYTLARVVWHERPGDGWYPLPDPTCEPGFYEFRSECGARGQMEKVGDYRRSLRDVLTKQMSVLVWEPIPTIRTSLMDQVLALYQQFEADNLARPAAVLMSPQDEARLLAEARPGGGPLIVRDMSGPATLFGVPIRVDRNMTPGQILFVGRNATEVRGWGGDVIGVLGGEPEWRREQLTQWVEPAPPPKPQGRFANLDLDGEPDIQAPKQAPRPNVLD